MSGSPIGLGNDRTSTSFTARSSKANSVADSEPKFMELKLKSSKDKKKLEKESKKLETLLNDNKLNTEEQQRLRVGR